LALARIVPTSTSVFVPVCRNSTVKLFRPCLSVPVGDNSTTSRSAARTV
jgi:hypothetical protein